VKLKGLPYKVSLTLPDDYAILKFILKEMRRRERVEENRVMSELDGKPSEIKFSLEKLSSLNLLRREKNSSEQLYSLTFLGLDVIAIKNLYAMGILKSLGSVIGEGKESMVYYGENFAGDRVAVKLHRVQRSSFRNARRVKGISHRVNWIETSLKSAEIEYGAMRCNNLNLAYVPKVYGSSINAIVMELIEGREIVHMDLESPDHAMDQVMATLRISYNECGLVHGDLSPYNVMWDTVEGGIKVIDWAQARRNDEKTLRKDIYNILTYFNRRYGINRHVNEVITYVKGG
jgi:RIO kinase 2